MKSLESQIFLEDELAKRTLYMPADNVSMNTSNYNKTATTGFNNAIYDSRKNSTKQIFDHIKKQQEIELKAI